LTLDAVIRRYRTGQDELARAATIIDLAANGVPDPRGTLPLVQEPWAVAVQQESRVKIGTTRRLRIDVEQHLACRQLAGRRRLSATLDTLDQYRTHCVELTIQQIVSKARTVDPCRRATVQESLSNLQKSRLVMTIIHVSW